jgi:hypothetical protein
MIGMHCLIESHRIIRQSGLATRTANNEGDSMAQNHYVTKTNRRPKNKNRKDPSKATMDKLRELAAADTKKASK